MVCEFADPSAMERFFNIDLRPALEEASGRGPGPVFYEFHLDEAPSDTVLEAVRELFPEVRGLGLVDWTPLDVVLAVLAKVPPARGRILVLAGATAARKHGEREWRQVLAALVQLARAAGVRIVIGDCGREAGRFLEVSAPKVAKARPRPEEVTFHEGETFRPKKRLGRYLRGSHSVATAFVSAMLAGTAGIALSWLAISGWQSRPEMARGNLDRPEGGRIAAVSGGSTGESGVR